MEVFFFGARATQLLGVYHAADSQRDRYQGVVLCYPFGQEYMRAHRAFRQLADSLARKGFHVLRFDYRGTGDSSGELDKITALEWLEDIECAIQELRDMAGVHSIALVGLRLGALLAGAVAARRHNISALVLWDPIVRGEDYLEEIRRKVLGAPARNRRACFVDCDGNLHFNGFFMPPAFQVSLRGMNLRELKPACQRILLVASHENTAMFELACGWESLEGFQFQHVAAEHDWNYVDHVGGILLPQPVLQEISAWM